MTSQKINNEWLGVHVENVKRQTDVKVRGYAKDPDTKKSTGELLYEYKTDKCIIDFSGATFGQILTFATAHARVVAQNKVRDLGRDMVAEFFESPISFVDDLYTTKKPAGVKQTQKLVEMGEEEFDAYVQRVIELRKTKSE